MHIISKEKIEDCFDGSAVYMYRFAEPWTRETIQDLKDLGVLDYFPHFPRPFFRMHAPSGFQIKGVQGDASCRVIFPRNRREHIRAEFESRFAACNAQDDLPSETCDGQE